ncbi:MAG: zinc ABC transporter substrate-binding protein, partial [Bacteroidota bacterium]
MMQNVFLGITLLCLILSCSSDRSTTSTTTPSTTDIPTVVATASIFADMAQNIAGDLLEVQTIVPIGSDPHLYEPLPRDAKLVSEADVVLMNGLTFEGWLKKLIQNSGTKAAVIRITDGVKPIGGEYKNATDPHAWMNVQNGLIYIDNIQKALVAAAPQYAEEFAFNYNIYRKQLEDLDKEIQSKINEIPVERRILITSHDAFKYYGQRYGVQLEAAQGVSPEAELTVSDIKRLNQVIQEKNIPAIFVESTINPKIIQQIAEDNNIKIGGELFADS